MRALIGIMAIVANAGLAWATADGPDFWRVTGVAANDVLNMRARATWKSEKIGKIPPETDGVANYGCRGYLSYEEFERATPAEREAARKRVWCLVGYRDRIGWVAGRYLVEGEATVLSHSTHLEDLTGTEWLVIDLVGTPPGAEATLRIGPDGVSGNGGCNAYRAGKVPTDHGLHLGPIAATRKACLETPHDPDRISIAETERRVFSALEATRDVVQADDILILQAGDGAVLATLQRVGN